MSLVRVAFEWESRKSLEFIRKQEQEKDRKKGKRSARIDEWSLHVTLDYTSLSHYRLKQKAGKDTKR